MSNLKCHDYTCRHNATGCCSLDRIDVSVQALCLDYRKGILIKSDEEIAEEIKFANACNNADIHCHSCECINNEDCRCTLNNLRIDRVEEKAICVNKRYPHSL